MTIQKATIYDIDGIFNLEQECYSLAYPKKNLLKDIEHATTIFFTAKLSCNNNIAGYIIARTILGECEIDRITTAPECRRSGIAEGLLRVIEKICIDQTIHSIFLEVNINNQAAMALYKKSGFVQVGRRPHYYDSDDALILKKEITYVNDTKQRIC